jgi:bile acid:Na+ symporter, BASS family
MEANLISTLLLPLALGVIMFGLGLHLTVADFKRVLTAPKPILIGLVVQMLVLPPIAFAICVLYQMPPLLAVGIMLLVASPGGATANVFSHLARADVALNISLTALNSILILFTLPLVVQLALAYFAGSTQVVPPPTQKIVEVAMIVLTPVGLGMLLRAFKARLADQIERVVQPLSLLILLSLIAITLHREWALFVAHGVYIGSACLILNLASMGIGYGVARLSKLPARQAVAISFEIGVHNSTLAIFIALSVLKEPEISVPAAIYSLLMYVTAGGFAWYARRYLFARFAQALA